MSAVHTASGRTRDELLEEIRQLRKELSGATKQAALYYEVKQAETALRESEERYRRLFEDDLTGDYVATPTGQILACNPAFVAIFNFRDREEALAAPMPSLYPEPAEHRRFVQLLRHERKLEYYECLRRRRDGSQIHIVENAVGLFDSAGELQQIRGYLFDNTAHKIAEQGLREAEQRYRSLIEFLPEAVVVSDGKTILFANPGAARLFGVSRPEQLVGQPLLALYHPDEQQAIRGRLDGALRTGQAVAPEHRHTMGLDAEILDVEMAITPIVFDGKAAVLCVNRDISAQIKSQVSLQQKDREISLQLQKIEQLNMALTTLLEHREQEAKRQLESVRATIEKLVVPYVENLRTTRLNDDQQILVEVLSANIGNIASQFARQLESWKTKLTPTEIQVADLLRLGKRTKEIASLLKVSPSAVAFHRNNIRAKLGLTGKAMNLVSYMRVMAQDQPRSGSHSPAT